jgi:hypothetical protein
MAGLAAIGKGKNTLAGDDIHPMNKPITQRHNQLPFNQEIKAL